MLENNVVIEENAGHTLGPIIRKITYAIADPIPGQKVSGFLKEKGYSQQNLVNLKKDEQSILINGNYEHQNYVLQKGDRLTLQIRESESSDGILPVKLPFTIVYEDEDLFVIDKPAGMPIHPSRNNPDNSLGNALAWYMKEKGIPFVFRCINRLDRDTSGLTIVAKHMVSAAVLSRMVAAKSKPETERSREFMPGAAPETQGIHREYLAIVQGNVEPPEGVIDAPIARKESACLERVVDSCKGDRAVTHYRKIAQKNGNSLVLLKLETGRTHQIRVHMKYLGYPLIGDFLYNPDYADNQIDRRQDRIENTTMEVGMKKTRLNEQIENKLRSKISENSLQEGSVEIEQEDCQQCDVKRLRQYGIRRQALHACRLQFPHPMTGEWMEFTAPLPEDMQRLL